MCIRDSFLAGGSQSGPNPSILDGEFSVVVTSTVGSFTMDVWGEVLKTSYTGAGIRVEPTIAAKVPEPSSVSYTHLRAHETVLDLVCRLLLEKKKHTNKTHNSKHKQNKQQNHRSDTQLKLHQITQHQ